MGGGLLLPPLLLVTRRIVVSSISRSPFLLVPLTLRDVGDEEGVVQTHVDQPGDAGAGGADGPAGHGDEAAVCCSWDLGGDGLGRVHRCRVRKEASVILVDCVCVPIRVCRSWSICVCVCVCLCTYASYISMYFGRFVCL
jgi:hypothetical protein